VILRVLGMLVVRKVISLLSDLPMEAHSCTLVKRLNVTERVNLPIRKGNPNIGEEAHSLEPSRNFWLVWENLAYKLVQSILRDLLHLRATPKFETNFKSSPQTCAFPLQVQKIVNVVSLDLETRQYSRNEIWRAHRKSPLHRQRETLLPIRLDLLPLSISAHCTEL